MSRTWLQPRVAKRSSRLTVIDGFLKANSALTESRVGVIATESGGSSNLGGAGGVRDSRFRGNDAAEVAGAPRFHFAGTRSGYRRPLVWAAAAILSVVFASDAPAAAPGIRFRVDFDLMVNCEQPIQVRNFIVHGSGTGVINLDKSTSADIQLNAGLFPKTIHFEGGLGRGSTAAPGGTSRVSLVGRNRIRVIWDLPNNRLVGNIAIAGQSCSASLDSRLKPGMTQHTFFDGSRFYYCGRPALVRSVCAVY